MPECGDSRFEDGFRYLRQYGIPQTVLIAPVLADLPGSILL